MIVKVKFSNDHTMLFGDSYKPWNMQFEEYVRLFKVKQISVEISISKDNWIGWGGLKWCSEEEFQNQLKREGCQDSDPDNIKPRLYENMNFEQNKKIEKLVDKILSKYRGSK